MKPESYRELNSAQLPPFADGSGKGYGSVSYIRHIVMEDDVRVTFVAGKSRILPLKHITVP